MSNIQLNQPIQNPDRIVILGASGFVASNLKGLFLQTKIPCITISKSEVDLTDKSSVDKLSSILKPTDVVVMASALTPDKGKDRATMLKNIAMADTVAFALEKSPIAQFILISSDAVYSDSLTLISESSPTDPSSLYGVGHITREKILQESSSRTKIPLLVLRPCAIYGDGDTHNSYGPNRFLKTARETKKISLFGSGIDKRDHLNINDLCQIVLSAIQTKATGILNVASGEAVSFFEAAKLVSATLGGGIEIETQPQTAPASYRHFDVTELIKAFPRISLCRLADGLKR